MIYPACAMKVLWTLVAVAAAVVLLSVRVLLRKGGRFSSQHVSQNRLMKSRGIGCAVSQDREERRKAGAKIDVKQL